MSHDELNYFEKCIDGENKKIIHRYIPNIDEINKKIPTDKNKYDLTKDFNRFRYRIIHPLIDRDGGMIFNSIYSPLIKVDICSNLEWFNTEISHHSNEFDFDGNIWTPATLSNSKFKGFRKKFIDDSVNKVSKDGKTLFLGSNGKLSEYNFSKKSLPFIFGNPDSDDFLNLKNNYLCFRL